jgi:hypothetical protein
VIKRLRPKYSDEELSRIYRDGYEEQAKLAALGESPEAKDHDLRIEATLKVGQAFSVGCLSGADLSAGHGDVLRSLDLEVKIFGDAFYDGYDYLGPIEETVEQIPEVDLFILTETLEHLDDPISVLRKIRQKSGKLLLSTPLTPYNWADGNLEHYWSWDKGDVASMFALTGWTPLHFEQTSPPYGYIFQIWGCQ